MKRNWKAIREILLDIEEGTFEARQWSDAKRPMTKELHGHVEIMRDRQLIPGSVTDLKLLPDGRDMLEYLRDETRLINTLAAMDAKGIPQTEDFVKRMICTVQMG